MASGGSVDFLNQYKAISSKLKKRFLRKPNVSEASEQFSHLAKQLQNQECRTYAAFTQLAVARCENTVGNSTGEAQALIQAARQFLNEERENYDLKCPTYDENLNSAINCYNHAIRVYLEQKCGNLAASLSLELANELRRLGKVSEAIGFYLQAAELLSTCAPNCLSALEHLASCHVEIGAAFIAYCDFDHALALYGDMAQMIVAHGCDDSGKLFGAFRDLAAKVEVFCVLLLLLLRPGPQRLSAEHSQLLEKYAWESKDFDASACLLGADFFLMMQSLVMAHQSSDLEAMKSLQKDLWPYLSARQHDLLYLIITKFNESFDCFVYDTTAGRCNNGLCHWELVTTAMLHRCQERTTALLYEFKGMDVS